MGHGLEHSRWVMGWSTVDGSWAGAHNVCTMYNSYVNALHRTEFSFLASFARFLTGGTPTFEICDASNLSTIWLPDAVLQMKCFHTINFCLVQNSF